MQTSKTRCRSNSSTGSTVWSQRKTIRKCLLKSLQNMYIQSALALPFPIEGQRTSPARRHSAITIKRVNRCLARKAAQTKSFASKRRAQKNSRLVTETIPGTRCRLNFRDRYPRVTRVQPALCAINSPPVLSRGSSRFRPTPVCARVLKKGPETVNRLASSRGGNKTASVTTVKFFTHRLNR